MKIAVISSNVFTITQPRGLPGYGGLECVAYECAKGLAAKGHKVALIAPDGSECQGCEIISAGPPGQWDERRAYSTYWQNLLRVDVVIDHSWMKSSYILKMEGKLKAPILGVLHAPINTMYQTLPPVEKPCFVAISQDQADHFNALHSPVQAKVCRNGIDLDFYRPMNVPRTKRFLFLARFSSIKGPDLAIEACRKAGVGLDLIGDTSITGEPEYFEKCKKMCDVWPISAYGGLATHTGAEYKNPISMVGPKARSETVWWYSRAHCFLHPNKRYREPLGLAPLEAQACGLPVIAYDYGAMRETIKHGETGWLVKNEKELQEKVAWMAQEGNISNERRAACREWAMKFSIQKNVNRYEELCQEALGGGW